MKDRIAIVAGLRTPFCKANGVMRDAAADDLGAYVVSEVLARSKVKPEQVDELIFGNVLAPPESANIARIIAVKAGLPVKTPAYTVSRNCASGLEAIASAADKLQLNRGEIIVAGGTESMSNYPVAVKKTYKDFLMALGKAKTFKQKLLAMLRFRPSMVVPVIPEIADPLCGLSMGQTAEVIAREFKVTRQEQDQFAAMSHQRAEKAIANGWFAEEIVPVPLPPKYTEVQAKDEGPRNGQTVQDLEKLKPVFDKLTGTVTAGNSSPITDGAAAVILMRESKAKELGIEPLGFILDYAVSALQPSRMGLGPAIAITKVLDQAKMKLSDIDLIEINEAFAAQIIAVSRACASDEFAKKEMGREKGIGELNMDKLNVNGGAIALGHPLGASGARLVITMLNELRRRKLKTGIVSLCIGGGQGQAAILEVK